MKLLVDEDGSELAAVLWDDCDAALASRLAYPEVCAALAAAARNQDLSPRGLGAAQSSWEEFWRAVRPIELTASVERAAGVLAGQHALRGADAVHLASALAVEAADLVVAVWDRRLHQAAMAVGLAVSPATLPS